MDRRTVFAIAICFLIFFGWQKLYMEPRTLPPSQDKSSGKFAQSSAPEAPVLGGSESVQKTSGIVASRPQAPVLTQAVTVDSGEIRFGNGAKVFDGWTLSKYRKALDSEAEKMSLNEVLNVSGAVEFLVDHPEYEYLSGVRGKLLQSGKQVVWEYQDDLVSIRRAVEPSQDGSLANVRVQAEFKGVAPKYFFASIVGDRGPDDAEKPDRQILYYSGQDIHRVPLADTVELLPIQSPLKWIGAANRYFLFALLGPDEAVNTGLIQPDGATAGRASLVYPIQNGKVDLSFRVFFGPKDLSLLRSVEPTLDHAVDFGWFTIFAYPLLKLMKWLYGIFANYGVAIIVLTLIVKILTFPLTYKSMKSMKEMAKLNPHLQKLKEKHKDNREALNREMMALMKTHGYNPLAGCLPILVQMPVFFALYRVLYSSVELYQAPFALWILDLSAKDPYYITPVALTLVMFIQQKLTPMTTMDPMQQKMMQLMPIIFGVFMVTLPSGLALYMFVNAVASIGQQLILNKKLDLAQVKQVAAKAK